MYQHQNHQQGRLPEWFDCQFFKDGPHNPRERGCGGNDQRDRHDCRQGIQDSACPRHLVEYKDNETPQNADVAMGKMDHIQGAEKETETDGDKGVITPQKQAVNNLLDKFQGTESFSAEVQPFDKTSSKGLSRDCFTDRRSRRRRENPAGPPAGLESPAYHHKV